MQSLPLFQYPCAQIRGNKKMDFPICCGGASANLLTALTSAPTKSSTCGMNWNTHCESDLVNAGLGLAPPPFFFFIFFFKKRMKNLTIRSGGKSSASTNFWPIGGYTGYINFHSCSHSRENIQNTHSDFCSSSVCKLVHI